MNVAKDMQITFVGIGINKLIRGNSEIHSSAWELRKEA